MQSVIDSMSSVIHRFLIVFDLPYQTWLILQKVGFRLVDLYTMKIPRSLWTNMYEKHYPLVAKIRRDYIIVVRKPRTVASLLGPAGARG